VCEHECLTVFSGATVALLPSCGAYIQYKSIHTLCDHTLHMQATASLAVTHGETARVQETLTAAGIVTCIADDVQWDADTDIFTSAEMAVDSSAMQSASALLQQCR
jgi:hypothetical protein